MYRNDNLEKNCSTHVKYETLWKVHRYRLISLLFQITFNNSAIFLRPLRYDSGRTEPQYREWKNERTNEIIIIIKKTTTIL